MSLRTTPLAALLAAALAAPAAAQSSDPHEAVYRIDGEDPGLGPYQGQVEVQRAPGGFRVEGVLRTSGGATFEVRGRAVPGPDDEAWDLRIARRSLVGLTSGLTGGAGAVEQRAGTLAWRRDLLGASATHAAPGGGAGRETWVRVPRPGTVLLKVMTLNTQGWFAWLGRPKKIAAAIAEEQPDVVCLQEVLGRKTRSGQARKLARLTGYEPAYHGANNYLFTWIGNGVLSRGPILEVESVELPRPRGEQRTVLRVRTEVRPGLVLDVYATHLHNPQGARHAAARLEQGQAISDFVARSAAGPYVVAGDLNARPGEAVIGHLTRTTTDAWAVTRPGEPGGTHGGSADKRIDYVLVPRAPASGPGSFRVLATWRRGTGADDDPKLSDHRAVLATLELTR